jgi:predicted cupin superfamily sugar epimerase
MDPELAALIARLDLRPHPEGGWYRETFRDPRSVRADGFDGPRSASTAIYFLLAEGNFSALHRILSDEVWHHYAGGDVEVTALSPDGARRTLIVGHHAPDASPQAVVPAGEWFGARVAKGGGWALVGCTVAPGFEFSDLELGQRAALTASFPAHAEIIAALTR